MAYYFVSEFFIKTATTVSANVDIKNITPHLAPSSDMFIKPILRNSDRTNTFYNALLASYVAQTLTADEITLVGYIRNALAWRVAFNAATALSLQINNKGPQLMNGDNSTFPQDNNTTYYLLNSIEKNAEFYQQELVDYLELNSSLYSGFTGTVNLKTQYDSGVASYENYTCRCRRLLGYCTCGNYCN